MAETLVSPSKTVTRTPAISGMAARSRKRLLYGEALTSGQPERLKRLRKVNFERLPDRLTAAVEELMRRPADIQIGIEHRVGQGELVA